MRKRKTTRTVYACDVAGDKLTVKRGGWVRTIDHEGETIGNAFDAKSLPMWNLGDRGVLIGTEIGVGIVEITKCIDGWGRYEVKLVGGDIHDGGGYVMRCELGVPKLKVKSRSRYRAQEPLL